MRDVHNTTLQGVITFKRSDGYTTSQKRTNPTVLSQRSDIVPTEPSNSGAYFKPTNYKAHFYLANRTSGGFTSRDPVSRLLTEVSWSNWIDKNLSTLGCNASQRVPIIPAYLVSQVRAGVNKNILASNFNAAVFLGELKDTFRMLTSILSQAADIIRNLRDLTLDFPTFMYLTLKDIQGRKGGIPKAASEQYLLYMYGLKPLMNDVHALLDGMPEQASAPIVRAFAQAVDPEFTPATWPGYIPGQVWFDGEMKRGIKAEASFRITDPEVFRLSRYGVTSPLSLVWELATLSFVIDWFIGVGNMLSTFERPLGISFVSYQETRYVAIRGYVRSAQNNWAYVAGEDVISGDRFSINYHQLKSMQRIVGGHVPVAPPFLRMPEGTSQLLSLVALIAANAPTKW